MERYIQSNAELQSVLEKYQADRLKNVGTTDDLPSFLEKCKVGHRATNWIAETLKRFTITCQHEILFQVQDFWLLKDPICIFMLDAAPELDPKRPVRAVSIREESNHIPFESKRHALVTNQFEPLLGWEHWLGWYIASLGEVHDRRLLDSWIAAKGGQTGRSIELFQFHSRKRSLSIFYTCFLLARAYDRCATFLELMHDGPSDIRPSALQDLNDEVRPEDLSVLHWEDEDISVFDAARQLGLSIYLSLE